MFKPVLIGTNTRPILWILVETLVVQHTLHHVCELVVLIPMGHLAQVGAGGHLLLAVQVVQHAGVDTANCLHTLSVCHATEDEIR